MRPFLLHHLLRDQAGQRPDSPALEMADGTVTYSRLAEQCQRLAAALESLGVRRHDRVGIYLPKGAAAYTAIFASSALGCAYVPLDAGAPVARVRSILRDCGVKALITEAGLASELLSERPGDTLTALIHEGSRDAPPCAGITALDWDTALMAAPRSRPEDTVENDLAYILYTSGSTGRPKGVMISHRGALSFVEWAVDSIGLCPGDRVAAVASLHFDLSIFDLFATGAAGATLVPLSPGLLMRPQQLVDWIVEKQITVWYSTPSLLLLLLNEGRMERHAFPALRRILFAGEVFPVRYLRRLRQIVPAARLFNLYGPTETNVCTFKEVDSVPADDRETLSIGRACTNVEVAALDENGCEVGSGEEGELWVRGSTVMLGYWGDREKTAAVLRRQPRLSPPGELWYATGDLVHRDATGEYHFHGRRDLMVKVRGYRVELGEVEAALSSHPDIREQAVVALPDTEQGRTLRAYVVVGPAQAYSPVRLKAYLGERLPSYMIPAEFRCVEALPKTSTGKIDRQALLVDH